MAKKSPQTFQHSAELKRLYNQLFAEWSRKYRLGPDDLAQRCGVSTQYLAHIGRYGRIPGKPILILLALVLEASDPQGFLRAAGNNDPWPFEIDLGLRRKGAAESGFLSVNLDMAGFADVIRDLVRSEMQPKTIKELLRGRPLRIGVNRGQLFLVEQRTLSGAEGFFAELMRLLALALHCEIEFVPVSHAEFLEQLKSGVIDIYGPVYFTPPRMGQALFTHPFAKVQIAGAGRTRKAANLNPLPVPQKLSDLRKREYRVAVHADSMAHHFALTELGIPEGRLLPCESAEEMVERIILTSLPRPAHLILADLPFAGAVVRENAKAAELLFSEPEPGVPLFEDTIAIRADWPAMAAGFNDTLDFLQRNGSVRRLAERTVDQNRYPGVIVG